MKYWRKSQVDKIGPLFAQLIWRVLYSQINGIKVTLTDNEYKIKYTVYVLLKMMVYHTH